ncbi:hypothetical protein WJU16_12855 [Chitinophaga pollutisoli]|uniref:Uncharacterized protein n=1 Tax=Chitinophaga pollutisoli TaxID=3133966 RepID=A0ABZ2YHN4_9BACT
MTGSYQGFAAARVHGVLLHRQPHRQRPGFLDLTDYMTPAQRRLIAFKSVLGAFILIVVFSVAGNSWRITP